MIRTYGLIVGCAALLAYTGFAPAAEIKVFSTIGVQSALEELAPQFEKASGHKLNISWATAAILVKRVQAGESADLMVLTKQSLDALIKDNKASAGPDATFASSGMAMVIKKGAPKPDISTPDAFKQTLLNAKAIAYSDPAHGGASGVYFAKLLERMGIAEQMKAKTRHPPPSGNTAVLVVNDEAELAIQQEPDIRRNSQKYPIKPLLLTSMLRLCRVSASPLSTNGGARCQSGNGSGKPQRARSRKHGSSITLTGKATGTSKLSSARKTPTPITTKSKSMSAKALTSRQAKARQWQRPPSDGLTRLTDAVGSAPLLVHTRNTFAYISCR